MLYLQDDGREVWTEVSSVPVSAQGRPTGEAAVVITDIDARKRAEAAVRENEGRLRELIGELAVAVWETDADGLVVADSPSWRAYTGQSLENWLGEGWIDAVHPDDRARVSEQWRQAVAELRAIDAVFRLSSVAGGWRRVRTRAAPLFDVDGSVRKWVGMNVETRSGDRA